MSFLSRLLGLSPSSSASEIKEVLNTGALIIDVRTEREFSQGHATGALNIPLQVISGFIKDIKKHNKPVVVYCRSGARAGSAMSILKNAGLEVYNAGGLGDIQQMMK